jgi:IclR family acetate operon transcriptional repressor
MPIDDTDVSKKTGTRAIERAISILRIFGTDDAPLRLSEVSASTGLTTATTHRILASLVRERLLSYDQSTERYQIGPDALYLFAAAARRFGISAARSELETLAAATHETAALGVLESCDVIVVLQAESDLPLHFSRPVGTRVPAHVSAMGKAMIAGSDLDLQASVEALGDLHRYTDHTITDRPKLIAELEEARSRGWAVNDNERYDGVRAVAMPVRRAGEVARAAVGIQGPADRVSDAQLPAIVESLRDCADRLSLHLQITF